MSTSFAEALSPLAARMPRVVREHEVLRVAGTLPVNDPVAVARKATAEVLKWATKQAGTSLPEPAWEGESFDLPLPGRDPSAIRLRTDTADLWAFRLHRPDRDVPGRAWTTEVVLGRISGQPARFSARLLVATDEANLAIVPAVPGFVRQIAQKCGVVVGSEAAAPAPIEVRTREDAEALIDHLTQPGRSLPTFVLTCFDGASVPPLDADALNGHVLGLAHVAVAHADACWALTERFGKRLSVFGGAARVYQPGFDEAADPYGHRLVLPGALVTEDGAERTARWLRETAAQASLHRTRLGREVLTFAAIRTASLDARQAALRETGSERDQLAAALEQIKALREQVESIRAENDYYLTEYARERERAEVADAQASGAAWRIHHLTEELRKAGGDPDSGVVLPTSWDDLGGWCERQLAGRLVLSGSARRSIKKAEYANVEAASRSLLWLATDARNRFINGGGALSNITILDRIQNAPCGADAYEFDWSGQRLSADWHVKSGGNTHDPARCLRIYYCFDPPTQQIVVSDMPAHRRTDAT